MTAPATNLATNRAYAPKKEYSVTAVIAVMNETTSLRETCRILFRDLPESWFQVLIVYGPKTTPESMAVVRELEAGYDGRVVSCMQKKPFVGGAYQDAFDQVQTTHLIMMSSDLETDPNDAVKLIAMSQAHPDAIIAANRWLERKSFSGYNPLKLVLNFFFQKMFSLIFTTRLSDMTYGYRLYPTALVRRIKWECLRHPFFFETIVKPLRLKTKVYEIPSQWKSRVEGESQNTFFRNFDYIRWGLIFRVCPMSRILKAPE